MIVKKIFNLNNLFKTLLIVLGCFIISIGIDFYIKSNIGGDSMTTFLQGGNLKFNLKEGTISLLINLVFVLLTLFINYRKIGIGTIIIVFAYGLVLNVVLANSIIPFSQSFFVSIIYSIIGIFFVSLAITIWINTNFGVSPLEGFAISISEKTKIPFWVLKVVIDLTLLLSGILMGGTFGAGTIISSFLVGPSINVMSKVYLLLKNKIKPQIHG
ncbi:TPA: hypothetical protein GXZ54_04980 [bacterium]|nr:hypothetical protein [bacterium]